MRKEMEEKDEEQAAQFKNLLFAHSIGHENTELFLKLYPEDFGMDSKDEAALEWVRPESPADVQRMMDELRETGWGGG
jgi:hypothetical protein